MSANNFDFGGNSNFQITINIQNLIINNVAVEPGQIQKDANVLQNKSENKGKSKLLKVLAGIVGFFKIATKRIRSVLRLK